MRIHLADGVKNNVAQVDAEETATATRAGLPRPTATKEASGEQVPALLKNDAESTPKQPKPNTKALREEPAAGRGTGTGGAPEGKKHEEKKPDAPKSTTKAAKPKQAPSHKLTVRDFYAYLPEHKYIFIPTGELWPAVSVSSCLPFIGAIPANVWLDKHRPVEQLTWAPGFPQLIENRLIVEAGWIEKPGRKVFNQYIPPVAVRGDPNVAQLWIDHVRLIYPDDAEHIFDWLSHRIQKPGEKLNHALVLGGAQGIGKDSLLEPAKYAVGPWNYEDISPSQLVGRFNGFLKSVILRVSEAHDLGDLDRLAFYERTKTVIASPPDTLLCDEKYIRAYAVLNVCGVIFTTNNRTNGLYLPADDRRHFVAWSALTKENFAEGYWRDLWGWYETGGGFGHVAAFLRQRDLSRFDPKAPPPKTAAFWDIVDIGRAPEDAELADLIDMLDQPDVLTIADLVSCAKRCSQNDFSEWLRDRKNRRQIPRRLEAAGYVPVRNTAAKDGLWKIEGRRQAIYAKQTLSASDKQRAAAAFAAAR